MFSNLSRAQKKGLGMAVIALIVGIYYAFIAPAQMDFTQNTLLWKNTANGTNWSGGPASRFYMGALLRSAMIIGGLALIGLAYPLFQGRKYAWPTALTLLAIAPIGQFFIGLGYLENFSLYPPVAYPLAWNSFILGLFGFWGLILLKDMDSKKEKISIFITLTLLGMIGSQAFALALHAYRVIARGLGYAISVPDSQVMVHTGGLMLLVIVMVFIAIYKLAQRKESGWWYAIISGAAMAYASFPAHYIRPPVASLVPGGTLEASALTSTYWMAGAQAVLLVVLLLIPYFKNNLYDGEKELATAQMKTSGGKEKILTAK